MFERVGLGNLHLGWCPRRKECRNSVVQCSHRMGLAFHAIAEFVRPRISTATSHPSRGSRALPISTTRTKGFGGVRALYLQTHIPPTLS